MAEINAATRARHGATFVLRHVETNAVRVVVSYGLVQAWCERETGRRGEHIVFSFRDVLHEMAEMLDRAGNVERVEVISTPASIVSDLRRNGRPLSESVTNRGGTRELTYEERIMGQIGRSDLVVRRRAVSTNGQLPTTSVPRWLRPR